MTDSGNNNTGNNGSGTSHAEVSSLLAAWTMCACTPYEASSVERHLRACETCRAEVRDLAKATHSLAVQGAPVPGGVRASVLAMAHGLDLPDYAKPYAAAVSALDALMKETGSHRWTKKITQLVAADNVIADQLGLDGPDEGWREQADAICRALAAKPLPPDLLMARAYETWIHARDIALAAHKPLPPPPPTHLHAIADFAARRLPHAAAYRRVARPGNVVRLVLTGPGGGTWALPLSEKDNGITVEMTLDTLAFCLLMAGRTQPRSVDVMIRGDVELGYDLLDAGPSLAPR